MAPNTPVVARTRTELRGAREGLDGGRVAVVMTMGALHDGQDRKSTRLNSSH